MKKIIVTENIIRKIVENIGRSSLDNTEKIVSRYTTDINFEEKDVSENKMNFLKVKYNINYSSTRSLFQSESEMYKDMQKITSIYKQVGKLPIFVRYNKKYIFIKVGEKETPLVPIEKD